MTSSNGNSFRVTDLCAGDSPVTRELPSQRPVTQSFDIFFHLRPNKRLSKLSWGCWFVTHSCLLWRHCNGNCKSSSQKGKWSVVLRAPIQCISTKHSRSTCLSYLDSIPEIEFIEKMRSRKLFSWYSFGCQCTSSEPLIRLPCHADFNWRNGCYSFRYDSLVSELNRYPIKENVITNTIASSSGPIRIHGWGLNWVF